MEPLAVVENLDVFEDRAPRFFLGRPALAVDPVLLQRREEWRCG